MKHFRAFSKIKTLPWLVAGLALAGSGYFLAAEGEGESEPAAPAGPETEAVEVVPGELPPGPDVTEILLPPGVQEVIRLSLSGVGDEVILAFIRKNPGPFELTPEAIIYLTDIGIPEEIIAEMLRHSREEAELAPPGVPVAPPTPLAREAQEAETFVPPEVVYSTPPAEVSESTFHSHLAPYGTWYQEPAYGLVWQPTVAVIDPGWAPYRHRGRWIYTTYGWYWHSDYSWGWAPFHYGRWFSHPARGWVWVPDTVWGPAWVTWRRSDHFFGWAPLPPGTVFRHGVGFVYHRPSLAVHFSFGLRKHHFAFLPVSKFCHPHPWRHVVPATQVVNVFNQTTVINNFSVAPDGTVINEAIRPETVAAVTRSEVRKVEVRNMTPTETRVIPGRLAQEGDRLVVFRPGAAGEGTVPRADGQLAKTTTPTASSVIPSNRIASSSPERAPLRQGSSSSLPARTAEANAPKGALEQRGESNLTAASPATVRPGLQTPVASAARAQQTVSTPSLQPVHPSQATQGVRESLTMPHYRVRSLPAPQVTQPSAKPAEARSTHGIAAAQAPPLARLPSTPGTVGQQPSRAMPPSSPAPGLRQLETRLPQSSVQQSTRVPQAPTGPSSLQLQRPSSAPAAVPGRTQPAPSITVPRQSLPAPAARQELSKPPVPVGPSLSSPQIRTLPSVSRPTVTPAPAPQMRSIPQPQMRAAPSRVPQAAPLAPRVQAPARSAPAIRSAPGGISAAPRAAPSPRVAQPQAVAPRAATPSVRAAPQRSTAVPSRSPASAPSNR